MSMKKKNRRRYTEKQLDFLRAGYARMPIRDLTPKFNARFGLAKTAAMIRSTFKNHGITCGRGPGERMFPWMSRLFTPVQTKFLKRHYAGRSREALKQLFNARFKSDITVRQVESFVKNHGLQNGMTGFFKKGQKPWNAGTKGLMKRNSGTFKKGNIPGNTRPLWSERIDNKDGFILIKVPERNPYTGASTRYKHKHVWLWEQKHGQVPEGSVVMFRDGNKRHCTIGNLILVTRSELLHLNWKGYKHYPAELKPSVMALAKLDAKMYAREKQLRKAA